MGETILFYAVSEDHGAFSNFAPYPIAVRGERWPTSEHVFQAQKFEDAKLRAAIRRVKSPLEAARFGRNRKHRLRRDWDSARVGVMREGLRAKFTQHEDLRRLLLSTGDAKLVEHTDRDDFWGDRVPAQGRSRRRVRVAECHARELLDEWSPTQYATEWGRRAFGWSTSRSHVRSTASLGHGV